MIGTKARGLRHIKRLAKENGTITILCSHLYSETYEFIISHIGDDNFAVFSKLYYGCEIDGNIDSFSSYDSYDTLVKLLKEYPYSFCIDKHNIDSTFSFLLNNSDQIILTDGFNKKYELFLKENNKNFEASNRYFTHSNNSALSKYLYCISNGSNNFYFWAIRAIFKYNMPLEIIKKILLLNDVHPNLSRKLSKGTITAYTGKAGLYSLLEELHRLRKEKRINNVINTFNTAQKKLFKNYTMSEYDMEIFSKFDKLSFTKKHNFIRKISTETDVNKILHLMSLLCDVLFKWDKESFIDYINANEHINCNVIVDKDDYVIVKSNDYETTKRLTKNTNWCISKDKRYWNDYIENSKGASQFIIFDFSKKEDDDRSIIGFTLNENMGIVHSHDFRNNDLMNNRFNAIPYGMTVFTTDNKQSIFSWMNEHGLSESTFLNQLKHKYDWNKDSFLNFLNQTLSNKSDYYILYDKDNKLAIRISIDSSDIYNVYDRWKLQKMGMILPIYIYNLTEITFIDFNKDEEDPSRILHGPIIDNDQCLTESCTIVFDNECNTLNKLFNQLIKEWGLPYDIICRPTNLHCRFIEAYENFDVQECQRLIQNQDIKNFLKNKKQPFILNPLQESIWSKYSMDYINLFYNAGFKLYNMLSNGDFKTLIEGFMWQLNMSFIPSQKDRTDLLECRLEHEKAQYVGTFILLEKIIAFEHDNKKATQIILFCLNNRDFSIPSVVRNYFRDKITNKHSNADTTAQHFVTVNSF